MAGCATFKRKRANGSVNRVGRSGREGQEIAFRAVAACAPLPRYGLIAALRVGEFLHSRLMAGRVARVSDPKHSQHSARPALHPEHCRAREDPGKPVGDQKRHRSEHASEQRDICHRFGEMVDRFVHAREPVRQDATADQEHRCRPDHGQSPHQIRRHRQDHAAEPPPRSIREPREIEADIVEPHVSRHARLIFLPTARPSPDSLGATDPNLDPALLTGHSLRGGFRQRGRGGASVFEDEGRRGGQKVGVTFAADNQPSRR